MSQTKTYCHQCNRMRAIEVTAPSVHLNWRDWLAPYLVTYRQQPKDTVNKLILNAAPDSEHTWCIRLFLSREAKLRWLKLICSWKMWSRVLNYLNHVKFNMKRKRRFLCLECDLEVKSGYLWFCGVLIFIRKGFCFYF